LFVKKDDKHIYQNFPFMNRKTASAVSNDQRTSGHQRNSKLGDQKQQKTPPEEQEIEYEQDGEYGEEEEEQEEELQDEDEQENDEDNEENEQAEEGQEMGATRNSDDLKKLNIPKGWKMELTKYKRKCFINELNGEKVE
jgi:cobalamin biosynthesis protein CobT